MNQAASYSNVQFQENQVLWAKIRGYPWWPAYVNQAIFAQKSQNNIYTVVFFGDNTNSKLGPVKLRKFFQFYGTFFQKSSKNKKLKNAIEKAQQRLQQNGLDVSIYERIRQQVKMKKKKNNINSEQKISSEDRGSLQDISLISRSGQRPIKILQLQSKKDNRLNNQKMRGSDQSEYYEQDDSQDENFQIRQPINEDDNQDFSLNQSSRSKQPSSISKNRRVINRSKGKSLYSQQGVKNEVIAQKSQKSRQGRSKKKQLVKQSQILSQEELSQKEDYSEQQEIAKSQSKKGQAISRGRKIGHQRRLYDPENLGNTNKICPNSHILRDVERVRSVMDNKQKLINLLLDMNITITNVKQISDLGITEILLRDSISPTILFIQTLFRETLLLKYFPQNINRRKTYENLIKKKQLLKTQFEKSLRKSDQVQSGQQIEESERIVEKSTTKRKKSKRLSLQESIVKMLNNLGIKEENAINSYTEHIHDHIELKFKQQKQKKHNRYKKIRYDRFWSQRLKKLSRKIQKIMEKSLNIEQIQQKLLQMLNQKQQNKRNAQSKKNTNKLEMEIQNQDESDQNDENNEAQIFQSEEYEENQDQPLSHKRQANKQQQNKQIQVQPMQEQSVQQPLFQQQQSHQQSAQNNLQNNQYEEKA